MKKSIFSICVLIAAIYISSCSIPEQDSETESLYGQAPPSEIPEVFEVNFEFITNGIPDEFDFSPDHKEFLYTIKDTSGNKRIIYYTKMIDSHWKEPEIASFVPDNGSGRDPRFSPDGKYVTFSNGGDLWRAEKSKASWAMAEKLQAPISTEKYECGISYSKSGNIYFAGNGRPDGKSNQCDIYCTKFNGTTLDSAINVDNLNTERSECTVCVSPNEDYITFTRYFNKQGRNATDLYISFRSNDSNWTVAQDLGPFFNCTGTNFSPKFTSDGKYFFFKQGVWNDSLEKYELKQYWVSTNFFNNMRDFVLISNNLVEKKAEGTL